LLFLRVGLTTTASIELNIDYMSENVASTFPFELPVYSPVCDTNLEAYFAYLAVCSGYNGAGAYVSCGFGRGGNVGESRGVCGNVGGSVDGNLRVADGGGGSKVDVVHDCVGDSSHGATVGGVVDSVESSEEAAVGVSACASGCPGGGLGDGVGLQSVEETGTPVGLVEKGRHWKKNQRTKARRKFLKASPVGAFSALDGQTRKELQESHARLLLKQNEVNCKKLDRQIKGMDPDSLECVARNALRVATLAADLRNKVRGDKVAGWAETIANSLTKSVASSAPSSVPSLESVGYGETCVTSDANQQGKLTVAGFEAEKKELDKWYFELDAYDPEDYRCDLASLKERYIEVLRPDLAPRVKERAAVRKFLKAVVFSEDVELQLLRAVDKEYVDVENSYLNDPFA